jgi:hypothetical protein
LKYHSRQTAAAGFYHGGHYEAKTTLSYHLPLPACIPLSSLSFTYAFLYKHAESDQPQAVDHNSVSVKLSSVDRIKIFLKPVKNAYIYLFFQDTEYTLYLLFPTAISHFDGFYQCNKNYYVTKGDEWFVLDDSSFTERLYFIVSEERLTALEALTNAYLSCYYSKTQQEAKLKEARQKVVEAIKIVRLEHGQEDIKEDIVLAACDFSGMGNENEGKAMEVEADGIYAKAIWGEHEEAGSYLLLIY